MTDQNTEIPKQVVGLFDGDTDPRPVMVTIRCITYNQERYIRDALEGFVMQKTNFRFEAIVHDDASTDGTAAIVREYAEKYPDIIKPIYETENQYSKRDGSLSRIMNAATRGKYTAMCEGDDYWTNPDKLQKQVDFLEAHPDYSMCFHNAMYKWDNDTKNDYQFSDIMDRDYEGIEIFKRWIVPTASVVLKSDIFNTEFFRKNSQSGKFIFGDTILFCTCAKFGKLRGFSDVMSVYRRVLTSVSFNKVDYELTKKKVVMWQEFARLFKGEYVAVANRYIIDKLCSLFIDTIRNKESVCWKALFHSFRISPIGTISFFSNIIKNKLVSICGHSKNL